MRRRWTPFFPKPPHVKRPVSCYFQCVDLMTLVVAKIRKSVHAAYRAQAERMQVSVRSIYNKLAGIEPQVCERLVTATSNELWALLPQLALKPNSRWPATTCA